MIETRFLKSIRALLIDIDGTLLSSDKPLPGMVEFFNFLNQHSINYLILSNNSTKTPYAYYQKIISLGGEIQPGNILTSAGVTVQIMKEKYTGKIVYLIGEDGIREALEIEGYHIIKNINKKADFVVVGGDHYLTYEKLKYASLHLQAGAQFIGTNPDVLVPSEEGLIPECGVIIAALEAASGRKAIVIGKPNPLMFQSALKQLGKKVSETAMIGDRLETDIFGGIKIGLNTILVETGVDTREAVIKKGITPDLIVKNLFELISIWSAQF